MRTRTRRAGRIAPAAVAAAGLVGCALGERIERPRIELPTRFEAPAGQAAGREADLDRWWRLFGDPQLTNLVEEALRASPDARAAAYRLQEARAERAQAIASILPKGDLQASASDAYARESFSHLNLPPQYLTFFNAGAGSTQTYAASFSPSWEIDLFGRDFAAVRTADAALASARFAFEGSRLSLAAEVATELFQARGLATQIEDARETARLAHDLAAVAARKAAAGLGTTADAARTLGEAEADDARTAALEAQLAAARRSLLVLLGRGGAPSSDLTVEARVAPPPSPPATAPGDLLRRRPDVLQAAADLREAAGELRLDKLALFPTLTLQPAVSEVKQVIPLYALTTGTASGGLSLSAPILGLPGLLAAIRVQGARGREAVVALEKAAATAYGEAERTLTAVDADGRRVRLLENATRRARFAYDAASRGYGLGLVDLTTVIQAEQGWRQTRAELTTAEIDALVDTVSCFKALGGGWTPPEALPRTP